MSEITDQDYLWERQMSLAGEEKYEQALSRAKEKDALTLLVSGRTLLRHSLPLVEANLREYLKENAKLERARKKSPGKNPHPAYSFLRRIPSAVVALRTTAILVDGLHRSRPAVALAASIGRSLEDEDRFRTLKRDDPGCWLDIKERTKHSGPIHSRRVAVFKGNKAGTLTKGWGNHNRVLAGLVCLEAFIQGTGIVEYVNLRRFNKRLSGQIVPTDKAIAWLEKADSRGASMIPQYLPTLSPPKRWTGWNSGGYITDLLVRAPLIRATSKAHKNYCNRLDLETEAPTFLESLNRIQEVAWEINDPVLETLQYIYENEGSPLPKFVDQPTPPKPEDIDTNEEARTTWRRAVGRIRTDNRAGRSRRIMLFRILTVAQKMRGKRKFYFPHKADFRGRLYPIPTQVHPQGPDIAKSLLQFHEKVPLTVEGFQRLLVYGANLWGEKGSVSSREKWSRKFLRENVSRIFDDPLEDTIWHEADEPFQFLAWCLELGAIAESGWPNTEYLSQFPVHVDAKNNGLQLFSLMSGDRELAKMTSAIPSDEDQDIYEDVAQRAWSRVKRAEKGSILAAWLPVLDSIPRSCAKRPVMTLCYGVTLWSAQNYVAEWYLEEFGREGPFQDRHLAPCRELARVILEEVQSTCGGAVACMSWLQSIANMVGEKNSSVRWTSPSGFPVFQDYRKSTAPRVSALLGGIVRSLTVRKYKDDVSVRGAVQGISPNFVHSVDAAILAECVSGWEGSIAAVHDSFATHASRVPDLLDSLRRAVATVAIEKSPLERFREEVSSYYNMDIPAAPRLGEIGVSEVLQSEELFS